MSSLVTVEAAIRDSNWDDDNDDDDDDAIRYSSRRITCSRCMVCMGAEHIQLRTLKGDRDLHCKTGGDRSKCGFAKCQCKEPCNRCEVHRIDPVMHKSKKAPNKGKQMVQKEKGKEKCYLTHAPRCRRRSTYRQQKKTTTTRITIGNRCTAPAMIVSITSPYQAKRSARGSR